MLSDRLSAHAYKRENGVTNEAIVIEWAAAAAWPGEDLEAEEGVQAYGGSYLSVTSSGSIRYEFGVVRFLCNDTAMSDGFEKQILAPTVPRCVHASYVSFEICVSLVVKSLFNYQDS